MSKCGVIQRDARINKPKLKIYKFEDGTPKGDATCVYIKVSFPLKKKHGMLIFLFFVKNFVKLYIIWKKFYFLEGIC